MNTHLGRSALGIMPHVTLDAFGLARIGRSEHDLRGIRHGEGDGGNAPATPPAATPPAPGQQVPAGAPGAAPAPKPAEPAPKPNEPAGVKFEDLDPTTQRHVRDLRAEAASNRAERDAAEERAAAAEEQKNRVLAALGLKPDGSEQDPDPEALKSALDQTKAETEQTKRENLVLRVGPALGANVDRLLDSRSFTTRLAALKVDDREGVSSLIREALEQDSSLKSAPAPASSSGGTTHTGNVPSGTRKSKAEALRERFGDPVRPSR